MTLSIIIPSLNEQTHISTTLQVLQGLRQQGHEIIIVDGGSDDQTLTEITGLCDHIIHSPRGRARQMQAGANQAKGSVLWFLHADTRVSEDAANKITTLLTTQTPLWGRFDITLSGDHWLLRIVEALINLRSRMSGIATGDQGIFVSRSLYDEVGGFPQIPLMEDIALSRGLKRRSKPICLKQRIITSSRRWEEQGILRTILLMWCIRLAYAIGVSPGVLVRYYR